MSISSGVELGAPKIALFKILLRCTEMGKEIHPRAQHCQNYDNMKRWFQTKIHIIGIFGSIESSSESTFPFQLIIISLNMAIFGTSSSIPRGSRHVRPLSFL